MTTTQEALDRAGEVDLAVTGMTCASCVARVEKKLNAVPGVRAEVNLTTSRAHLDIDGQVAAQDLLGAVERAGYEAKLIEPGEPSDTSDPADAQRLTLQRRLLTSAVLTTPVLVLSMIPPLQFAGWQWLVALLSLPVVTWGAWPFHRAAARAARHASSTMDTLVSLGVIAATLWSLWALLLGGAGQIGMQMSPHLFPAQGASGAMGRPELYFEVAAVVTTFLLAGRYAESRSRHRAGAALRSLLEMGAKDVAVISEDGEQRYERRIPIEELAAGDLFYVRPGEKVATDGIVVEGHSALDVSMLTGEPLPQDVAAGQEVTGATINTTGLLLVRATRVGQETTLAQIGRLVTEAQAGKAPVQRLADRISAIFVPIVLVLSLVTLASWLLFGATMQAAFTAAVAVLIIACPCALGLATPTALLVGSGRAAQLGIVIRGPEILESTREIDTIVLDKTGTVTEGRMSLAEVVAAPGQQQGEVLSRAAAVEASSEHPVAQAIVTGARAKLASLPEAIDFHNHPGRGVSATVAGSEVLVGRPTWLAERGIHLSEELITRFDAAQQHGATAVVVGWQGEARGVLVVHDRIKAGSATAISDLRGLGLQPMLLTGDNASAARVVATEVGIEADDVIAEVLPAGKREVVSELQQQGRVVAIVGDGVNDAAALAQAGQHGLGLAMGQGTDVAIEASDITLVGEDLGAAAAAIRISRATLRIIKQNLFWAFAYNVAAIPLAAFGLLNPMIAGAAMAASSLIVVSNALRLRQAE